MDRYRNIMAGLLAGAADLDAQEILPLVKVIDSEHGDLSMACFELAKILKKNPKDIAADLASQWPGHEAFDSVEAAGPYLNVKIKPLILCRDIIGDILSSGHGYLENDSGRGKTVVIDFSSPNIAKPLAYHHLRSTVIGNAIGNIHAACGFTVQGINYLGDWGKTFGLMTAEYLSRGDRETLEKNGIRYLLDLYVNATERADQNPDFDEEARSRFRQMEQGEPETRKVWELFRSISLTEFERIYERLGVKFEHVEGESRYSDRLDDVIREIEKKPGVRVSEGALIVDIEYEKEEPPCMLKKADGATLYLTRDIAAAIDRWERFSFSKSLYVVATDQSLHFRQLKKVLKAMGHEWSDRMTHVNFGRVHGMSTRKGSVIFLKDVLDEGKRLALEAIKTNSPDLKNPEHVADQVGIGALLFADMRNQRSQDYAFDWKEQLNFKGFTGASIQYAHARCCSVLGKSGIDCNNAEIKSLEDADLSLLTHDDEIALVKAMAKVPAAVLSSAHDLEPYRLSRSIYEIAKAWHRYQQAGTSDRAMRILADRTDIRMARLALVQAARTMLAQGMNLLGMPHPEAM